MEDISMGTFDEDSYPDDGGEKEDHHDVEWYFAVFILPGDEDRDYQTKIVED